MTIPYEPSGVRVLLVASDPEVIRNAGSLLKNDGYDIFFAPNLAQAAERCMEEPIDLVVCSADAGDGDPYALCEEMAVRAEADASIQGGSNMAPGPSCPPFIFLVDRKDPQAMPRAFRARAADCVSLPCQPEEFLARVRRELELLHARRRLASQRVELDAAWKKLEAFARLDALTGLPDRGYAARRIEEELSRARRSTGGFCVVTVVIPPSPSSCPSFDRVFKSVASILRAMLRDHDLLCRWSERELLLVLPDSDRAGAEAFSERCQRIVRDMAEDQAFQEWRPDPEFCILPFDPSRAASDEAAIREALRLGYSPGPQRIADGHGRSV